MNHSLEQFELLPWNKNFDTGIALIDEQHRNLINLLNKLANCLVYTDKIELTETFTELADYASLHFDQEEAIWHEHFKDDSWLSSHQMSHASFMPAVQEIQSDSKNSNLFETSEVILKFLIRWLVFHIIDSDKRMSFTLDAINQGSTLAQAKVISDKKMSGSMRELIDTILQMYDGLTDRTIELLREKHARLNAENKLETANEKLDDALDKVKKLQELIPICSYCKGVRDDKGVWNKIEAYLATHSDALLTHGICPDCLVKQKQELQEKLNSNKK